MYGLCRSIWYNFFYVIRRGIMKKVKLIYNPYSGENVVLSKLHNIISIHQQAGLTIVPYRIVKECSIEEAFEDVTPSEYEYILVAGGDGTVDSVVNTMAKKGISLPIGILPVGTANDFSKFLGIPFDVEEACKQIINSTATSVDLGKINDKYFVNVASTGLFTDVSQKNRCKFKKYHRKVSVLFKGTRRIT